MTRSPTCFMQNSFIFHLRKEKKKEKNSRNFFIESQEWQASFEACATGNVVSYYFSLRVENDKYPFDGCATGCYPLRRQCYWKILLSIFMSQ